MTHIADGVQSVLETALRDGAELRGFLSGGGLRVLNLRSRERKEIAYGEHPYVHEALRILAEDYIAGHRPYDAVYGVVETHYLTGAAEPAGELDAWLRRGHRCLFRHEEGAFVCVLRGVEIYSTPDDITRRAAEGETVRWTDARGVTRCAKPSRLRGWVEVHVERLPEGMSEHRADCWYAARTGRGATLVDALEAAFRAPSVEEKDHHGPSVETER